MIRRDKNMKVIEILNLIDPKSIIVFKSIAHKNTVLTWGNKKDFLNESKCWNDYDIKGVESCNFATGDKMFQSDAIAIKINIFEKDI